MSDYNRDLGILSTYSLTLRHPRFICAILGIFLFLSLLACRCNLYVILSVKTIQITSGLQCTYLKPALRTVWLVVVVVRFGIELSVKLTQLRFEDCLVFRYVSPDVSYKLTVSRFMVVCSVR
jgi:hypothetical protein